MFRGRCKVHTLKKPKSNYLNHLLEAVRGVMSDGKPSCLRFQTLVPVSLGPSQRRRTRPGGAGVPHAPSSAPPSGPEPRARHSQRERPPTLCQFWSQAGRKKRRRRSHAWFLSRLQRFVIGNGSWDVATSESV